MKHAVAILFMVSLAFNFDSRGQTPKITPESYADLDSIWKTANGMIPVCWESPSDFASEWKEFVKSSIKKHIENLGNTSIRFSGWLQCQPKDLGIRITITEGWPASLVGQQWLRNAQGAKVRRYITFGDFVEQPTLMNLNFSLNMTEFSACRNRIKRCVEAISVHEFMHAIGFLHEHLRDEAKNLQPECPSVYTAVDAFGYNPVKFGEYDFKSAMNYCYNIYSEAPFSLSDVDKAAIRYFYPPL